MQAPNHQSNWLARSPIYMICGASLCTTGQRIPRRSTKAIIVSAISFHDCCANCSAKPQPKTVRGNAWQGNGRNEGDKGAKADVQAGRRVRLSDNAASPFNS